MKKLLNKELNLFLLDIQKFNTNITHDLLKIQHELSEQTAKRLNRSQKISQPTNFYNKIITFFRRKFL